MTMPFFSRSMPKLRAALLGVDVSGGVAVVGLLLIEDVAERVDMAVRVAVVRHAIGVGRKAAVHGVLERLRVVWRGLSVSGLWASDTLTPFFTRSAACRRFASVIRFAAPS